MRTLIGAQLALDGGLAQDRVVNISEVRHRSPFRYPGGKTWLVPRIRHWLGARPPVDHFVEPFAGGASVGLTVAFEGLAERVTLIELDDDVAAVWATIFSGTDRDVNWLVQRLVGFTLTRENLARALDKPCRSLRDTAFRTLLRNRVNHGGILADGVGVPAGERGSGIGSRWYPETVARRILKIRAIRDRIEFLHGDAFAYLAEHGHDPRRVYFVDPPYSVAGARLYRHSAVDHPLLLATLRNIGGDFIATYDNAPEIIGIATAQGLPTRLISMARNNHSHQQELLIGRDLRWL